MGRSPHQAHSPLAAHPPFPHHTLLMASLAHSLSFYRSYLQFTHISNMYTHYTLPNTQYSILTRCITICLSHFSVPFICPLQWPYQNNIYYYEGQRMFVVMKLNFSALLATQDQRPRHSSVYSIYTVHPLNWQLTQEWDWKYLLFPKEKKQTTCPRRK